MSPPAPSTGIGLLYVIVAVLVLVLLRAVRRTIANYKGTRFSLAKTVAFACTYVGLGVFLSGLSYLEGVPILLAVPEVLIAIGAALWSFKYTSARISFWKTPDGSLNFRGGILIYLIYMIGIVARVTIDIIIIGPGMLSSTVGAPLSGMALYGSMITDLVLILGVGLLIGRSIQVERRYRGIKLGRDTAPILPGKPPGVQR